MAAKIRAARLAAYLVESGDVLVTAEGRVIGRVIDPIRHGDGARSFKVRTPEGPVTETRTYLPERPVWVNVPYGQL